MNALTDAEHPCQILADLLHDPGTLLGEWRGKTVCYLGDGACNVPGFLVVGGGAAGRLSAW